MVVARLTGRYSLYGIGGRGVWAHGCGRDPARDRRDAFTMSIDQRAASKALKFLERGACYLYRHYHPGNEFPKLNSKHNAERHPLQELAR
jgi:hypothetical protein